MSVAEARQSPGPQVDQFKATLLKEAAALVAAIRPALSPRANAEDSRIGDNQWRSLCSACQEATVLDEIKALIEYKIGKDTQGRGWALRVAGGKTAGQVVLEHLERVEQAVRAAGGDEYLVLEVAALFFGYVSWRVVAERANQGGGQG